MLQLLTRIPLRKTHRQAPPPGTIRATGAGALALDALETDFFGRWPD